MGKEKFQTVPQAMGTLLVDCVLSGTKGGPLMRGAWDAHPFYSLLFFCFALLANVTVMGVLGAVLVQTIKKIAEAEEDSKQAIQNHEAMDTLWAHIIELDENGDGFVTREEFLKLLSLKSNLKLLTKMGVDPASLIYLADFIFDEHDGRLSQKDLKQWVLDLRGSQKSTIKDHYVTRALITARLSHVVQTISKESKFSS